MLHRTLQRGFEWLAICKGKVLGSAQHKGLLTEKVAYRYICCQPHLLDAIAELNVVTSPEFIERLRPICADRLTDDANPRTPRQGLYLSNEHQRLEITLIL